MEKQDIIKIYFYLDKNKVKILTTEYDLSDFNRKFSGNIEVFNNLIQNKVKGYDKVEIYINRRGRKLWISNDFFIDTIIIVTDMIDVITHSMPPRSCYYGENCCA